MERERRMSWCPRHPERKNRKALFRHASPLGATLEDYNAGQLQYTGGAEIYFAGKVLLVALSDGKPVIKREIFDNPGIYAIFIDGQDIYGVTENEIYIAENALL